MHIHPKSERVVRAWKKRGRAAAGDGKLKIEIEIKQEIKVKKERIPSASVGDEGISSVSPPVMLGLRVGLGLFLVNITTVHFPSSVD